MMIDRVLDNALAYALRAGADQCEIFVNRSEVKRLVQGEGEVKEREIAVNSGFSLKILKDKRLGFSYGSLMEKQELRDCIDKAMAACDYLEPEPGFSFTAPGGVYMSLPSLPEENLSYGKELSFVEELEKAALACECITKVDKASLTSVRSSTLIKNSLGLELEYDAGYHSASVIAVAEDKGEIQTGGDFNAAPSFYGLDGISLGQRAAFKAKNKLGAVTVPGGTYPVILHGDAVLDILSVILPAFLGDNIRKGQSMLIGKLGHKISQDAVSLYDDPLLPNAIASVPFDDEGTPCRPNVLLEKGRVMSFLYDNMAAAKSGTKSTGSGFTASTHALPTAGFTNYYLATGASSLSEMLSKAREGLYIRDFMGLHMANGISGDFSLGISGNVIRDGELKEGFRGNMAAGNVFELLKNIELVGNKQRFYGYRGAPDLLVNTLSVSGKD